MCSSGGVSIYRHPLHYTPQPFLEVNEEMLCITGRLSMENGACKSSYRRMVKALGSVKKYGIDTPIPLSKILEVCGLDDALWCLLHSTGDNSKFIRLLSCHFAEEVQPFFDTQYPNDDRPYKAICISRLYANGVATSRELATSKANALRAVRIAARGAMYTVRSSKADAAWAAARAVIRAITGDVEGAAEEARAAMLYATKVATKDAKVVQTKLFLKMLVRGRNESTERREDNVYCRGMDRPNKHPNRGNRNRRRH